MMTQPSYLTGCYIKVKATHPVSPPCFTSQFITKEDVGREVVTCALDDYAIIPRADYDGLIAHATEEGEEGELEA